MMQELAEKYVKKSAYQLLEIVHLQEEEERQVRQIKQRMEADMEGKMRELNDLETEKNKLEAEIMSLKLQDKAYQREHLNFRNSITIIKYKIEKIKESIEKTKKMELEDLKEFEEAVDEITEKFRSSPAIYDRRILSQKLDEERERRKLLLESIQEARESYANFNKGMGLRERSNEEEELLNCALPGSEIYHLMEMTKNLDEVIRSMRDTTKDMKKKEDELKEMRGYLNELTAKTTDATVEREE